MKTFKTIWNFMFNNKTFCGKKWIKYSMSKKYGEDWFEQCFDGLRNPKIKKSIAEKLKLKTITNPKNNGN